jgi:hypothetical protein
METRDNKKNLIHTIRHGFQSLNKQRGASLLQAQRYFPRKLAVNVRKLLSTQVPLTPFDPKLMTMQ